MYLDRTLSMTSWGLSDSCHSVLGFTPVLRFDHAQANFGGNLSIAGVVDGKQMTAMIDVVFQLLIFFLVASKFEEAERDMIEGVFELACHPGYFDPTLEAVYHREREHDRERGAPTTSPDHRELFHFFPPKRKTFSVPARRFSLPPQRSQAPLGSQSSGARPVPFAQAAHSAACANEQGRFWEQHEALYRTQPEWFSSSDAGGTFRSLAQQNGMDVGQYDACMNSLKYAGRIQASLEEGIRVGVNSTPSFRIGDRLYSGVQPYDKLKALVDSLIAATPTP